MHLVSLKDVFDTCAALAPGFNYNDVESILGLGNNVLQRRFNTRGFRKCMGGGYELATKDFDAWCVLMGVSVAQPSMLSSSVPGSSVDPTGMPNWISERVLKWHATELDKLVGVQKSFEWDKSVDKMVKGTLSQEALAQVRLGALYLALMADYAMNDPRYAQAPETIWETRLK